MSDFTDDNVITEEFSAGVIPVSEPAAETSEEPENSDVDDVEYASSSPSIEPFAPTQPVQPASDDATSLDNLRAVSAVFDNGCKTLKDVVTSTGLSQPVVLACIKWLKDNGLIAVTGSFYCTIDNVSSLQKQLKVCSMCK